MEQRPLKKVPPPSPPNPGIRRGEPAQEALNAAILGGGRRCYDLLRLLERNRLHRVNLNILGVFDANPEASGFRYAQKLGLFVTTDMEALFTLDGLNLIIDLSGFPALRDSLSEKESGISIIDHKAAGLLWDLICLEADRGDLEKERQAFREKSRTQTQVILDSLPYRIMVVGMNMDIITVNRTFLKELGFNYDEVIGRPCYEVRYGLKKPCFEFGRNCFITHRLNEIKNKGLISTYQEYVDEQGQTRFDVVTIAPIYDEGGDVVQILEASRDVTDRIRLEREVQKSNTFFEKVIQSTVDGIVVVDTKGNVLIFNEGMENLTGYSAGEIINKGHLSSFYNMDVAKENMRKMRSDRFGPPGKLNPTSMTITTKDGKEIPVTLSAALIKIDGKEMGSVGVFTDMREVLNMRKELEDANIQLIQSQKIASIGRMAAGVAHEINNPLSAILIFADMLKNSLKDNAQYFADIQEIVDQTLRCKRIVTDLLEFSRKSAGKTSSFSLETFLTKCLDLLVHKAQFQNIDVTTDIEKDMPNLVGDMSQLQQVFTNLLVNAADAMEGKGKLSIRAWCERERGMFVIRVSDTGPGIPENLRDKIFDIFFTTKPVGKGTGLGLGISQNIIKIHGGNLSFECPPQGGTTFIVELPLRHTQGAGRSGDPIFIGEEPVFIGLDEP